MAEDVPRVVQRLGGSQTRLLGERPAGADGLTVVDVPATDDVTEYVYTVVTTGKKCTDNPDTPDEPNTPPVVHHEPKQPQAPAVPTVVEAGL